VGRSTGNSRRRCRGEGGAALVEAAIILPVVVLLTFGAIEFGIGFSQKGGLQSVARAGARIGATLTAEDNPTPPGLAPGTKIGVDVAGAVNAALGQTTLPDVDHLYVYRVAHNGATWAADGFTNTYGQACGANCIRFDFDESAKRFDVTNPQGSWPGGPVLRNACSLTADRIGVTLQGRFHFLSGLVGTGAIDLQETAVLQLEPTTC
jgi:hypothetical protein